MEIKQARYFITTLQANNSVTVNENCKAHDCSRWEHVTNLRVSLCSVTLLPHPLHPGDLTGPVTETSAMGREQPLGVGEG
jgi:hypothetical protein